MGKAPAINKYEQGDRDDHAQLAYLFSPCGRGSLRRCSRRVDGRGRLGAARQGSRVTASGERWRHMNGKPIADDAAIGRPPSRHVGEDPTPPLLIGGVVVSLSASPSLAVVRRPTVGGYGSKITSAEIRWTTRNRLSRSADAVRRNKDSRIGGSTSWRRQHGGGSMMNYSRPRGRDPEGEQLLVPSTRPGRRVGVQAELRRRC